MSLLLVGAFSGVGLAVVAAAWLRRKSHGAAPGVQPHFDVRGDDDVRCLHFSDVADGSGYLELRHQAAAAWPSEALQAGVAALERDGFVVVRGILSSEEVRRASAEVERVIEEWPDRAPPSCFLESEPLPMVAIDPDVLSGKLKPREKVDGVRRLFRVAVHDEFFRGFAKKDQLLALLRAAWGTDSIRLIQSMALLKPPGTGEKRFHQDQAYFRLRPPHVAAWWIALDHVDTQNGCMVVWPGSHCAGVREHRVPAGVPEALAGNLYSCADGNVPPPEERVAVEMRPGDGLLFHGDLVHGTPPNRTRCRRWALQLHYADADCRPSVGGAPARGVAAPDDDGGGFDCAPLGKDCVQPQYWSRRKAELTACGRARGQVGFV